TGVRKAIESARADKAETGFAPILAELADWFAKLSETLRPFADAMNSPSMPLTALVTLHCETAEQIAATAQMEGKNRLWRGDDGEAAAVLMEAFARAGEDFPDIEPSVYPPLLRQFADEIAVRPAFGRHPRLA